MFDNQFPQEFQLGVIGIYDLVNNATFVSNRSRERHECTFSVDARWK